MRRLGLLSLCLALAAVPFSWALAAGYPDKPIRLVVPYEPGGGTDLTARLVAKSLTEELRGTAVVIENRPGAGGSIGTQVAVDAKPDGYTLLMATASSIVMAPLLNKDLKYDPIKDLAPIVLVANVPSILLVKPDSPINSVQDLIAQAKRQPGELSFASSGIGGNAHRAALMLKAMAGVDMLHVPYKGTGPALTAVLSGQTTMTFGDVIAGLGFVQRGQLKAIAITTPGRSLAIPNLPSIADTLPGYSAGVWFGLFAPANTPKPIVDKLNAAMLKVLQSQDVKQNLAAQGVEPIGGTPGDFAKFIKDDSKRWTQIANQVDLTK
jgi:tripartite-type tricarboxylate transporter receptor subunit TctC